MQGRITNIQRMSIHDGPGIRTTVFLKGCNMRCKWCHNPETWSGDYQLKFIEDHCIQCGSCVEVCPNNAWSIQNGSLTYDNNKCEHCFQCVENCYSKTIIKVGDDVTVEDVVKVIEQDVPFYKSSGGGVTISGGEPLLQREFAKELLSACREKKIHTALETNLSMNWNFIEELLPLVDLWMCDLKLENSKRHKEWTGMTNNRVIQNLERFSELNIPVILRTPIIPGANDNEQEVRSICEIVKNWDNVLYYEMLPFHPLGYSKYESLGMKNPMPSDALLDMAEFKKLQEIPKSMGIKGDLRVDQF